MYYINRKEKGLLETVDQFEGRAEALRMLKGYRMSDPTAKHYLSTRCCKKWNAVETEQEYFSRIY